MDASVVIPGCHMGNAVASQEGFWEPMHRHKLSWCWLASRILTISLFFPFPTVTSSIDVCRSPPTAQADPGAEARMRQQCLGTICKRTGCCQRRSEKLNPPNNPPPPSKATVEDQFSPLELAWGPFQEHLCCCDGADVPTLPGGTNGFAPHTFR